MDQDDLKSVKGSIPSLVELGWKEMFGATEAERLAAGRLRKQLRAAGATDDPEAYKSAVWKFELPSEADLQKSECGRQTLELFKANPPMTVEKKAEPEATVAQVEPEPAPAVGAAPVPEPDDTNEYMRRLSWPPKPTPQPKTPEDDDTPHKWQAAKPSPPDKSMRPLPPDLGEQEPIY